MIEQLVILCEANDKTGLGHFSRCLNIAQSLGGGSIEIVFCGQFNAVAMQRLKYVGFKAITRLNSPSESRAILVDSYSESEESLKRIKSLCSKLLVIDDFDHYNFPHVDAIINFRFQAESFVKYCAKHILGVSYYPFPTALRAVRAKKLEQYSSESEEISVLVSMGGHDRFKKNRLIITALDRVLLNAKITVLTDEELSYKSIRNKVNFNALTNNIAQYYQGHSFVISGGGSIKYEAGFCMLPNAALSQTPEQRKDTLLLQKNALCFDLGLAEYASLDSLVDGLISFFGVENISAQKKNLKKTYCTDSAHNLASAILEVLDV